jgi:hypothetical protein
MRAPPGLDRRASAGEVSCSVAPRFPSAPQTTRTRHDERHKGLKDVRHDL